MRFLRVMLVVLGIIQIVSGTLYLATPSAAVAAMLGVQTAAPPWLCFVLATAGARSVGYGVGMLAAARTPWRHQLWINTMLGIQIVDFLAILMYRADGNLTLRHLGPTAALPLLWVVILGWTSLHSRNGSSEEVAKRVRQSGMEMM
jgi:hypothetical protein